MTVELGRASAVVVYWRPGCAFCMRLLRTLDKAGIVVELRNIWQDDEARSFVARHNQGSETVPTVAVGEEVVINPRPDAFVRDLRARYPELVGVVEPSLGGWRGRLRLS